MAAEKGSVENDTLPSCVRCKLTSRRYTFRSRVPSDLRESNREIRCTTRVPRNIDTHRCIPARSTPMLVRSHPRPRPRRRRRNLLRVPRQRRFRSRLIVLDLVGVDSMVADSAAEEVVADSMVADSAKEVVFPTLWVDRKTRCKLMDNCAFRRTRNAIARCHNSRTRLTTS